MEIHVYEYEPMTWRQYSLEAHLNFEPQGTSLRDGTLIATHNQTHLTLEPTIGLSKNFAVGFMFLERLGNRVTRLSLPVGACCRISTRPNPGVCRSGWGLSRNSRFKTHATRKILGGSNCARIFDREFPHWQVVFNPVFERALHGPGTEHGWNFEPAGLLRWKRSEIFPVAGILRRDREHHNASARAARGASAVRGRRLGGGGGIQHQPGGRFRHLQDEAQESC